MNDRPVPPTKKERYMTTGQVAERCGVNFRTVIRWVQQGYLKAYRLPGARADHRIPVEDFERFMRDHQQGLSESEGSDRPILIVDDDMPTCRTLKRVLVKTHREVLMAHDGFTAGLMLNEHRPVLVTLDLKMKGVDGLAVLRSIRGNPGLKNTLVLVISGDAPAKLAESIAQGADATLAKPFKNQDLILKVEELLAKEVPNVSQKSPGRRG